MILVVDQRVVNNEEERNSILMNINSESNDTKIFEPSTSSEIYFTTPKENVNSTVLIEENRANACEGFFQYPKKCQDKNCQYKINWKVQNDMVYFALLSKITQEHWTGIGFSEDGAMVNLKYE